MTNNGIKNTSNRPLHIELIGNENVNDSIKDKILEIINTYTINTNSSNWLKLGKAVVLNIPIKNEDKKLFNNVGKNELHITLLYADNLNLNDIKNLIDEYNKYSNL